LAVRPTSGLAEVDGFAPLLSEGRAKPALGRTRIVTRTWSIDQTPTTPWRIAQETARDCDLAGVVVRFDRVDDGFP